MSKASNEELVAIEAMAVAYLTAFNRADVAAVIATYTDNGVLMGTGMPRGSGQGRACCGLSRCLRNSRLRHDL